MKYYCASCGAVFDEDDFSWDCPECGSSFVEECERCGFCNELKNPDTMIWFPATSFDQICPDCFGKYEAEYREAFLTRPTNDPERPEETFQDYFDEIKAVPVFKVKTFFDFIGFEDIANEEFFKFVKEQETRKAAERGKKSNVKVHYSERR